VDVSLEDILWLLLTAETQSSHPLAKGIVDYCKQRLTRLRNPPRRESNIASEDETKTEDDYSEGQETSHSGFSALDQGIALEMARRCSIAVVPGLGMKMSVNDPSETSNTHPDGAATSTTTPVATATSTSTSTLKGGLWSTESTVLVGNHELMRSEGVPLSKKTKDVAEGLKAGGKVVIFMAINGVLRALVGVSDVVRYEAAAVIHSLRKQGITCYMVTGDEKATALAIGASLGLPRSRIFSNAKPDEKEAFIAKLQSRGEKVVFVGDGTNDSPALARADVGIAMAGGTDIAIESGDVVLCKDHLGALVTALDLSRRTMRRIRMNYFWALAYNTVLIPVSAGVLFPSYRFALQPMLAGGAMALSSVSVVLSSLMLLLYRPPTIPITTSYSGKSQLKQPPHPNMNDGNIEDKKYANTLRSWDKGERIASIIRNHTPFQTKTLVATNAGRPDADPGAVVLSPLSTTRPL
jgi:soluble P-type ATPase